MKILAVKWKDATEHKDGISDNTDQDPLLYLLSVGFDGGKHKDLDDIEYQRLTYKKAIDKTMGQDDFIDIPTGCIVKTEKLCDF